MAVNSSDPVGLQAKVAGLERRVRYLETRAFGETKPGDVPLTLYFLYTDALMGCVELSDASKNLWNHAVLGMDEESLLGLTRSTTDPFSWRPLLFALDYLWAHGFDTSQAAEHILDVATVLLGIQGLGKLRPEDVLGWAVDPRNALSA